MSNPSEPTKPTNSEGRSPKKCHPNPLRTSELEQDNDAQPADASFSDLLEASLQNGPRQASDIPVTDAYFPELGPEDLPTEVEDQLAVIEADPDNVQRRSVG